ncbi:MAG TPA: TetR/AcrR family transcriptional regulator [Kofleriaceae bacterium]|nr:TetR/AcrR family transcriptional regulator [Kofleriaceae bacterium]
MRAAPKVKKAKRSTTVPKRATGVQLGSDVARNMIMFGATRVFATKGFRNVSVEDLLEVSQVSRRTFYRFFKSKEDVALAMYTMGTSSLLEACRRAITSESDLLKQLEKCIDLHLSNTRQMGRLIWVLGGEAQSLESPLHARRMEVHDQLISMFREASSSHGNVDPLLIQTLIFALEQVVRAVLEQGDEGRRVTTESIARARAVMMRVATGAVAGTGPRVAPLPLLS